MPRIRVGTVAYLNAEPLTAALDPARYEVVAEHPRAIAAALASGAVDVALAPVAAVLTDDAYRIVPGVCVGADGPVASVVIAAETPPEAWTELVLDGTSRTSVVLARLLVGQGPLAARVRPDLQIVDAPPGDGPRRVGGTVAAVVIGDPARALPPHLERYDLADLWKRWTGQPFVFAVWAARPGLPEAVWRDLVRAGHEGVASLEQRWQGDDLHYLRHHIRYALDDAALIGLRRFAALAHRAGLIGTEHVHLFGPEPRPPRRRAELDDVLAAAVDGRLPALAQVEALLREAPVAELGLAADLARRARHPAHTATYLHERRVAPEVVADAAALDAALAAPDEATVVRLRGLAALPRAARLDRVRRAVAAGRAPWGLDAADADDLPALAGGGLAALAWRVGDAVPAAVPEAAALGLPVHAELVVPADAGALAAALGVVRAAGAAITSVTVHLPLPAGALVEPGRPATATWLRGIAAARLALDVPHVVASPETQGLDAAQLALRFGADDLGAVGDGALDAGGETFEAPLEAAERALRVADLEPVRRDLAFRPLGGALTKLRRVRPVAERAGHAR